MIIKGYDIFKKNFSPSEDLNINEKNSIDLLIASIAYLILSLLFAIDIFKICNTLKIILGLLLFCSSIILMISAFWQNRKYDHVKLFYEELEFQEIHKNEELKKELTNTNINGIITVIENRNKKYISTYKMVWAIFTVLLLPTIKGVFDNISDFNVYILGIVCLLLIFLFSVICGFQMLYPLSREKQSLNAYLEYLKQINKNE